MDTNEAFALLMDEREKVGLLLGIHVEGAAGVEHHGVKVVQVFRVVLEFLAGKRLGVGPERGVPQPRLLAEPFDGRHRVTDGFVAISSFAADEQEALARRGRGCRLRAQLHREEQREAAR